MDKSQYQISVVGQDTIPQGRLGQWTFLNDSAKELKDGQALRLVIPKGEGISSISSAWLRACTRLKVKKGSRVVKQVDGSHLLFLWIGTNGIKRR